MPLTPFERGLQLSMGELETGISPTGAYGMSVPTMLKEALQYRDNRLALQGQQPYYWQDQNVNTPEVIEQETSARINPLLDVIGLSHRNPLSERLFETRNNIIRVNPRTGVAEVIYQDPVAPKLDDATKAEADLLKYQIKLAESKMLDPNTKRSDKERLEPTIIPMRERLKLILSPTAPAAAAPIAAPEMVAPEPVGPPIGFIGAPGGSNQFVLPTNAAPRAAAPPPVPVNRATNTFRRFIRGADGKLQQAQ